MASKRRLIHPDVPNWAAFVYAVLAIVTIPWTVYLSAELPENNLSSHWDVAWGGFDVGLLLMLASTAWLAHRKSRMLVIPAIITGTLLLVDAWFDIVTARSGKQLNESVLLALVAEIPLSFISYRIGYKMLAKQVRR